jgi:O-antigen/teichoic acid export membrane protein
MVRAAGAAMRAAMRLDAWRGRLRSFLGIGSRREVGIAVLSLAGSGLIGTLLSVVGGLVQARYIGPETLGFFAKFAILPGFLFFLHLGVFTALGRQYPYYIGAGERDKALRYAGNALGWTHVVCAAHAILFLGLCVWMSIQGEWMSALGWGVQIVVPACSLYMVYLGMTYRNGGDFVTWSRASVLSSVSSAMVLPILAISPVACLCLRAAVPPALGAAYAHWRRPLRIRARLERPILREMISFGAPIMVFAYVANNLWPSLASALVLKAAGERSLGLYGMAWAFCSALNTVAASVSQVFQPRIAMLFGSSRRSMDTCFRYCLNGSLAGLAVMLPLTGALCWLFDPVVRALLPKYVECVPYARWLCWLALIPVIDLPAQLLLVAKRTRLFGASVAISFLLFAVPIALAMAMGRTVTMMQVVVWTVLCTMFKVLLANGFVWHLARQEARRLPKGLGEEARKEACSV